MTKTKDNALKFLKATKSCEEIVIREWYQYYLPADEVVGRYHWKRDKHREWNRAHDLFFFFSEHNLLPDISQDVLLISAKSRYRQETHP